MKEKERLTMIWIKEEDSKLFDERLAKLSNKRIVDKPEFWMEDGIFNFRAYIIKEEKPEEIQKNK